MAKRQNITPEQFADLVKRAVDLGFEADNMREKARIDAPGFATIYSVSELLCVSRSFADLASQLIFVLRYREDYAAIAALRGNAKTEKSA